MNVVVDSANKKQVIDITNQIQEGLPSKSGLANIFIKHTTAAITTADLDPGTDLDLLDFLNSLAPDLNWRHPHNPQHAPDHLLSSIIGPQVSVPVKDGQLQLGTWQRIILIELDGPRQRNVEITFIS